MKHIFNARYAIDKDGNIYSCNNKAGNPREHPQKMKQSILRAGYLSVVLYINESEKTLKVCRNVHRLVAETFIPNPENKPCVNHINGNKTDNSIGNLEWVTRSENDLHAFRTKLRVAHPSCLGKFNEEHPKSVPINQLSMEGTFIRQFPSAQEAKRQGFHSANISSVIAGRRVSHAGFKWEYA